MSKFYIFGPIAFAIVLGLTIFQPFRSTKKVILSAKDQPPTPIQTISTTLPSGSEKMEILHFHATRQCTSCINIGKFTKATIEDKFPEEYRSGKIVFREINIDLPENYKIANDYKVSGSALYLNAVKDGTENHEEDTTVWRLVTHEIQLKNYFEARLRALL